MKLPANTDTSSDQLTTDNLKYLEQNAKPPVDASGKYENKTYKRFPIYLLLVCGQPQH